MIPVARPWLGEEELEAVRGPLSSGWVTQGPQVAAFEKEFADFVGAKHAIAVSNCTTALHAVLYALDVGRGDEVVTVSHSFIATANAICHVGAVPVFVDIDPEHFNIDPSQVRAALSDRTRAILCVHQMGMPCDLKSLGEIAIEAGVHLIEDAACAIGSEIDIGAGWERIGKPHGVAACFSFHPRKLLTTGDGGMITTNDDALDQRLRLLRHQGMSVSDRARHESKTVAQAEFVEVAFNYRLTDIQAAIGRVQLGKIPEMVRVRRLQADRYRRLFAELPVDLAAKEPDWARTNWQSYCIRLPETASQEAVMVELRDRGISTRTGIMNAHEEPAYAVVPWRTAEGLGLAESEAAKQNSIILPLFHDLTEADQERIAKALGEALG